MSQQDNYFAANWMRRYCLVAILENWPGWLEFQMTKFILLRQGITQLRKLCYGGKQNPVQPFPNFGITLHAWDGVIWSARFWIAVLHRVSCVSHIYTSQVEIPFLSYISHCLLLQVLINVLAPKLPYRILQSGQWMGCTTNGYAPPWDILKISVCKYI